MGTDASESSVQRHAEQWILDWVEQQVGVSLNRKRRLGLGGSIVEFDGASERETVLVEVFAHHGPLKGGQLHKVSTDILKLVTVAEGREPRPRLILAFADREAVRSLDGRSWRSEAIRRAGIEILVADLDDGRHAAIRAAQARQRMVNPPVEFADG